MNGKLCAVAIIVAFIGCVACENVPSDDQVISLINKLDEEQSLPLFGGLALEKVENAGEISPRSEGLTDRIVRYLKSHKVNFEISEDRSSNVGGKIKPVIVKKVKSTLNEKYPHSLHYDKLLRRINPKVLLKDFHLSSLINKPLTVLLLLGVLKIYWRFQLKGI